MSDKENDIDVRAFEPADAPDLARLLNLSGVVAGTLQLPFRSLTDRTKALQSFHPKLNLVAELEGAVVGHAYLDVETEDRCRHTGVVDIVVHDDYRRRGIGRRLMTELLRQAEDWLGLRRIELTVLADNHAAISLYEKMGFQQEGRFQDYALKKGIYVDGIPMAKINRG